MTCCIGHN